ncbi:MAG: hypothetical protein HQL80_02310 [Magnetococcales bacterium]|nr:hypothetical protein [Magnetococcales bacterium]
MNEATLLNRDIQVEYGKEMEEVRSVLGQVRSLVHDSVIKLNASFDGLRRQAERQNELVIGLADDLGHRGEEEADSADSKGQKSTVNIQGFVQATDGILRTFVDRIVQISQESMRMVYRMDDMVGYMVRVQEHLGKINTMVELTKGLALNARIVAARAGRSGEAFTFVATEIHQLAASSRQVSDQIGKAVEKTNTNVHSVRNVVKDMASKDMGFAMDAKDRVESMMRDIHAINQFRSKTLRQVSSITDEIDTHVTGAIAILHYEEVVTQVLKRIEHKLEVLTKFVHMLDLGALTDENIPRQKRLAVLRDALLHQQQQFDSVVKNRSANKSARPGRTEAVDAFALSQSIRAELRRELISLQEDSQQIRAAVQGAVGKLSGSFEQLRQHSAMQNELVSSLVGGLDRQGGPARTHKAGNITVGEFIAATDSILQSFVEHIVAVSRQSIVMMYNMDDVSDEMLQVEESLGKINAIADLTKVLGLNARIVASREGQASGAFSVVAAEVRRLAIASREVSDLISEVVVEASTHVDSAKEVVREMASKDMSFSMEAKSRVDDMMDQVNENDRLTARMLQQVASMAGEIRDNLSLAVLSLQFEDMVTQITQVVEKKCLVMEKFDRFFDLEGLMNDALPKKERIAKVQRLLQDQQQLLTTVSHKPVNQENMDEGDIELF